MSDRFKRHLTALIRRKEYLKSLQYRNSFDKAELAALDWAIMNLEPMVQKDSANMNRQSAGLLGEMK